MTGLAPFARMSDTEAGLTFSTDSSPVLVEPPAPVKWAPWVTFLTIALSVISTGLATVYPDQTYRMLYATNLEVWLEWKWWGLITSLFLHAGFVHLFFNCYWTWLLGRLLEKELGILRYLGLIVSATWLGSAAELAWSGQVGVGMSGMVYGLFGYMLVNRSRNSEFRTVLTGQNILLMIGWLILCFITTEVGVMQVANFAHLAGFVAGVALGLVAYAGQWRSLARTVLVLMGFGSFIPLVWAPWLDSWQIVRASRALEKRDYKMALESLERVRRAYPDYAWALLNEAAIREERGEYAAVRDILSSGAANPTDPEIWNNLSWLLATCPDEQIRNGAKAIELARRACGATQWSNGAYLDTLAAAYAEAGNFSDAVKWSDKSLEKAGANFELLRLHRESFRSGKPWRNAAVKPPP